MSAFEVVIFSGHCEFLEENLTGEQPLSRRADHVDDKATDFNG